MNQIYKIMLAVVSTVLVCSGMIPTMGTPRTEWNTTDPIIIDCKFTTPTVETITTDTDMYETITMGSLPNSVSANAALLPMKPLKILLPYGRTVESINVEVETSILLGVGFHVEKEHLIIPLESPEQMNDNIEDTDDSQQLFTVIGTYVYRGYPVLFMNLHPVQYVEETGEISWYNHMKVTIQTQPAPLTKTLRNTNHDRAMLIREVANPEVLTTYEPLPHSSPRDTIQYVIITNEELRDATGDYTFQDLLAAKQAQGMTAEIVTVEEIVSTPEYWVNGIWGDNNPSNPFYNSEIQGSIATFNDTQAKIRNFIRYAYTELGTEYVLLGGDADDTPSENIVPARKLFAVEDGLPLGSRDLIEEDIPSDVYYACLDGNFNRDGDDHWGENATQNGYDDEDEADLLSEVYVGRACADADDEVSNFVMKTLAYDASTDPYIYTALMVGEYLGFPGVSQYGGNYKDLIIPLIPEDFDVDTLYDRDGTWSKYDLMNILNTQTPHLVNHLGHGNIQYALKMYTSDIGSLTNDKYFFVYSQTCLAGHFDNSGGDCAAEYFTVETEHGAFAVIMNARYGLGSENTLESPSQALDESFFTALFTEHLHALGQASHYSKEDHIWHINENGIRWVYYETNLFGDPALRIKPYNYPPEAPAAPSGPDTGVIHKDYSFTATTTDPEEEQMYYFFDFGDGTTSEWIGPYPSGTAGTVMHQWTTAGTYEITAKAKDSNGGESPWSPPHTITIYSTAELEIGNITGGLFTVKASIKNTGFVNASHVKWTMNFTGGVMFGKNAGSTLLGIPGGEEKTVSSGLLLGLGKTLITVTASCDGSAVSKDQNATILFFFIRIN